VTGSKAVTVSDYSETGMAGHYCLVHLYMPWSCVNRPYMPQDGPIPSASISTEYEAKKNLYPVSYNENQILKSVELFNSTL
jgi:hypothetical protein